MARRSSRVLIFGLVLLVLGYGNWAMGHSKVQMYKHRQREAIRMGGGLDVTTPFRGHFLHPRGTDRSARALRRVGRALSLLQGNAPRRPLLMQVGGVLIAGAILRRIALAFSGRLHTQF
jgi:hypothetical protein